MKKFKASLDKLCEVEQVSALVICTVHNVASAMKSPSQLVPEKYTFQTIKQLWHIKISLWSISICIVEVQFSRTVAIKFEMHNKHENALMILDR